MEDGPRMPTFTTIYAIAEGRIIGEKALMEQAWKLTELHRYLAETADVFSSTAPVSIRKCWRLWCDSLRSIDVGRLDALSATCRFDWGDPHDRTTRNVILTLCYALAL
ncbi:hypothetical protein NM688_g3615 [Phlebia brevispora]|uniref:Uncharacterized protein n=1 Tax=Phlebia brevispora TaxID=194682 RepID=A0ACC1T519_9APHY|nr:hypothetical protein NM688_g3615 [Phlebia brevispora]